MRNFDTELSQRNNLYPVNKYLLRAHYIGLPRWFSGWRIYLQIRRHGQTWVGSLVGGGSGHPLEEGMATQSSILAWRNPWTEEPGGLQSTGSQGVGHDWSDLAHTHTSIIAPAIWLETFTSLSIWLLSSGTSTPPTPMWHSCPHCSGPLHPWVGPPEITVNLASASRVPLPPDSALYPPLTPLNSLSKVDQSATSRVGRRVSHWNVIPRGEGILAVLFTAIFPGQRTVPSIY